MGLRYPPRCVSNIPTNQTIDICHFSEDISEPRTRIKLPIAADTQNPFYSDFDPISGLYIYIYKYIDFHCQVSKLNFHHTLMRDMESEPLYGCGAPRHSSNIYSILIGNDSRPTKLFNTNNVLTTC